MDELKIGTPLDAFDYIVFFEGLKNMKVNISLFDLDHLTGFETPIWRRQIWQPTPIAPTKNAICASQKHKWHASDK